MRDRDCAPRAHHHQQTHTGQLGSLTSGFRGKGATEKRQYESIVSPGGYKKKIRAIRGERVLVSALPDPVQGFVNYSTLSHLSLEKADPVRRPDIPKTTVSGVVCPCPLLVSTHTHHLSPVQKTAHKELLCRATTHGIPR